ncbi:alpha/beta fold hydrolase [Gephyromycinifex aptenodytis]|uniref:alpha/beta fold hydrolase n=1 Tax=Gephyromycinifex aptenodytis TaxID=2716227 RepID=UPI001444AE5E|nr:alpha/beta hydrolase [Gephyromycinifex aptenodytis]
MPIPPPALPTHEIYGDGDVTVFLLHGAYGDGRYFGTTRDYFTKMGHRVVIWNCPGYAGSPKPDDTSIQAHAEAAAALVEAVGGRKNVLLGHSMGGLIAPLAANLLGTQVHGLILSASTAGLQSRSAEEQKRFIAERVDPITAGKSIGEYAPDLLRSMMGPNASGPLVDRVVEVVCEMPTDVFVSSMNAIIECDNRDALRQVTVPTLLVAGECDTACPPAGMAAMAELVPDSEYTEIPGAGHYPFVEAPEEYHGRILDFLSRRVANV